MHFSTALVATVAATLSTATAADSSAEPHEYASHFTKKPPPHLVTFPAETKTLAPRAEQTSSSEPHIYASHFLNKPPPHIVTMRAEPSASPSEPHIYASHFLNKPPPHLITMRSPRAEPTSTSEPHIYASHFLNKPPPHVVTMRAEANERIDPSSCDYCHGDDETAGACLDTCFQGLEGLGHEHFGGLGYPLTIQAAPTTFQTQYWEIVGHGAEWSEGIREEPEPTAGWEVCPDCRGEKA